jgi:hypothetical protein
MFLERSVYKTLRKIFLHESIVQEFEDTKRVIRIRKSKKDRYHNGKKKQQKDKQRSTIHTYKTKDRVTRTQVLRKGRQFLLH